MSSLKIDFADFEDKPSIAECFRLLESVLQPTSDVSANDFVDKLITHLLPPEKFLSNVELFFWVACEVSRQVPYDHPSMEKLLDILEVFFKPESVESMNKLGMDTSMLSEQFCSEVFELYHDLQNEETIEAANSSSFLARIEVRGLPNRQPQPGGAEMALNSTFNRRFEKDYALTQGMVMAAAQWIRFFGRRLFGYYLSPERVRGFHPGHFRLCDWQRYRRGFQTFAEGDWDLPEFTYSDESKGMASRAAAEMLAIEQEAGVEEQVVSSGDGK